MQNIKKSESTRYVGLALSGAKNPKTTLAVIEYFPQEKKAFLLDVEAHIGARDEQSADELLLEKLSEIWDEGSVLASTAPLTLPACAHCTRKTCERSPRCHSPAVRWMENYQEKLKKSREDIPEIRPITPYTQRPVEIWLRYDRIPRLPDELRFEVDETLGGGRAPLASRMQYLQKRLPTYRLIEAHPKLSLVQMGTALDCPFHWLRDYREIEQGAAAREAIFDHFVEHLELFVYENDQRKIIENLVAFDAWLAALTAFWDEKKGSVGAPKDFPHKSGWVHVPKA